MILERIAFILIFHYTFKDEENGKNVLATNAYIRVAIFDVLVPIGFIFVALMFASKAIVKAIRILAFAVYAYVGALGLSALLHLIMTVTDDVGGQFRIMIAATHALTECFNIFLVLVYLHSAQTYISMKGIRTN